MTRRTGVRLRAFLARRLDAATMERFIDPALADLQCEYENAVRAGRLWHGRRIWVGGHLALGKVLAWHGVTRGTRGLIDVGDQRRAMNHTLAAWVVFTAAASAIFIAPLLADSWEIGHSYAVATRLALLLVPQALTAVAPFSLMCGILWGLRRAPTMQLRIHVLLVAATASLGLFFWWGWVVPASNQAYRVIVFDAVAKSAVHNVVVYPVDVPKGLHELTWTELRQVVKPPRDGRDFVSEDARRIAFAPYVSPDRIVRQYHLRTAFTWSPLVLALFALALTARQRRRWWLGASGAGAIVAYMVLTQSSARGVFDGALPAAATAWLPNAAFLLTSMAIWTKTRRTA